MDLREHRCLHPDFVAAVRARYVADWPTMARDLGPMLSHRLMKIVRGGDSIVSHSSDARQLRQLADAIGYGGPVLDEVQR